MKIKEAVTLYKQTILHLDSDSAYKLGLYFYHGQKGFPQDHKRAEKYFLMSLLYIDKKDP